MRRTLALRWTIQRRIALAFVLMCAVSVSLVMMTLTGTDKTARLMSRTYDEVMVSNDFARAAAGDFANLKAALLGRQLYGNRGPQLDTGPALHSSFQNDLGTAIERAGTPAVAEVGARLHVAELDWLKASRTLGPTSSPDAWAALDKKAGAVEGALEALVASVSQQGAAYRAEEVKRLDRDTGYALAAVGTALVIMGLISAILASRISGPVNATRRFAQEIASGTLDGEPPAHRLDEVGDLIEAMVAMRADIAAMMDEQLVLRDRAQARIAEALEGSCEGVVIVDADSVIRIANMQALVCLGLDRNDVPSGTTVDRLLARFGRQDGGRAALLRMRGVRSETEETLLPDGRWIRNSRHRTTDGGMVALYSDISGIKDQQDRLAEVNGTLDAALRNMSQGLCLFDASDRLKLMNARCRELFGLGLKDCPQGTPYSQLVAHVLAGAGEQTAAIERLLRHERAILHRRRTLSRSIALGPRTIAITQQPLNEGGWIATYEDVTERRRADVQISFLANNDALTHLPNRLTFERRVEEAIARARRGSSFAVHCLDLDHFKQVNDTLGHAIGDQLLCAVTDRLLSCVRDIDTVARLGGDEFAILQADIAGPETISTLAERIVQAVAAPYVIEGHDILIGASIGIAVAPNDGMTHGLLLKSADAALYKAKEEGRRTWRFFELAMDETLQARRALEADLRRAIANEEFEVFYQPLLEVRSGKINGFEALVRWHHPTRGLVSPDQFIPVAEETGAIKEIGRWVLEAACKEAIRWPARFKVAVNVSTIQLREAEFVDVVTRALATSRLSPDRLELEITETVFMANTHRILPILSTLRGIGVGFAMDDFGTGYSSLGILRAFPFDKIKIDRSFIRDLGSAEAAGQIISIILALGRSLGMRVTAEGVETREQFTFLDQEGCDEIQGYLVGRPMPSDQIIERLARDRDDGWFDLAA